MGSGIDGDINYVGWLELAVYGQRDVYTEVAVLAEEWNRIIRAMAVTVRELRTFVGWSQQVLADRAVISQGSISRLESGNSVDVPFHSIVVVLRALAPALTEVGVKLSAEAKALLTFTQLPSVIKDGPINPDLVLVARTLNEMNDRQREAFLKLIRPLAELISASTEARNDSQGVLLRQHKVLSVQVL